LKSIYIVENDRELLRQLSHILVKAGYKVDRYNTGESFLKGLNYKKPDLIILSVMLSDINGLDLCKEVKTDPKRCDIPVIIISSRTHEADIIAGLESGADEYITKPFNSRIFVTKIKSILCKEERKNLKQDSTLRLNNTVINPERHEVMINGTPVRLTLSEFRVLYFLAERNGCIFSRYQIIDAIRKDDYLVNDRSIDVLMGRLRKKLGTYGKCIETIYGIGYRFNDELIKKQIINYNQLTMSV